MQLDLFGPSLETLQAGGPGPLIADAIGLPVVCGYDLSGGREEVGGAGWLAAVVPCGGGMGVVLRVKHRLSPYSTPDPDPFACSLECGYDPADVVLDPSGRVHPLAAKWQKAHARFVETLGDRHRRAGCSPWDRPPRCNAPRPGTRSGRCERRRPARDWRLVRLGEPAYEPWCSECDPAHRLAGGVAGTVLVEGAR